MNVDLKGKTEEELKEIVKRSILARKIVKEEERRYANLFWKYKWAVSDLKGLIACSKIELGKRKLKDCPVVQKTQKNYNSWDYIRYSCSARELSRWFYNLEDLAKNVCWKCAWTNKQRITRKMILRIKNGQGK